MLLAFGLRVCSHARTQRCIARCMMLGRPGDGLQRPDQRATPQMSAGDHVLRPLVRVSLCCTVLRHVVLCCTMLYCCRLAIEGVQPSIPQNPVPDSLTRSGSDRKRKEPRAPRPSRTFPHRKLPKLITRPLRAKSNLPVACLRTAGYGAATFTLAGKIGVALPRTRTRYQFILLLAFMCWCIRTPTCPHAWTHPQHSACTH